MRPILENIWSECERENSNRNPKPDDDLYKAVLEKGDAIRAMINNEQVNALEDYEERIYILEAHRELAAFKQGVAIAIKFIMESLL